MALTSDEVLRCKAECGYNVVGIGAEAYALEGYVALFDRAIQPYLIDLQTTSSTVVSASASGAAIAITLASNPSVAGNSTQPLAFTTGSNIVVDVGPLQETSQILLLSGLVATCTLSLAHGTIGPYPVKARGAEQFVRDIFKRIDNINTALITTDVQTAGIKKVDEIEFFGSQVGGRARGIKDPFLSHIEQRLQARRDLCLLLGLPYLPDVRRGGGGGSFEPY